MKRGFMDVAVTSIIPAFPGKTSRFYAEEYLRDNASDARNPIQSLANTLDKQVREGKEPRITRKRVKGVYLYFPASNSVGSDSSQEIIVQICLSLDCLQDIDNLVAVERFANKNDAVKWLIIEGIKANRDHLNKVAEVRTRIEQLKNDL